MRKLWIVLSLLLLVTPMAHAQDFGVMESAETVNQGNFKLRLNPMVFFGKNGADDQVGVAAVVGYGFSRRFDLEGGVALAEGLRIFGATAEFNVASNDKMSFSLIPGFHVKRGDQTLHTTGLDLILLGSTHLTPRLDFYGGLDMAFESSDVFDYKTFHAVPGLEYKLNQDLELLVEFGLALNDDAQHYLSGGLAFYFR